MNSRFTLFVLAAAVMTVAGSGCFNEPEPAYKLVPADSRVYLNDQGLKAFPLVNVNADYLNLDRNQLEKVDGVEKVVGLKWLRLNDNKLTSLPNLKSLVHLRRIYLKNNRLSAVPETLRDLPSLTDIDLSGNPIKEIPTWLAEKGGLKNLSFSRTQITKLPEKLEVWRSLHCLQLGDLNLSAGEMARIRKALPNVAIVF